MGGKTTVQTTSNKNETQTAAPPSWTLPGLEQLAARVINVIPQVPGEKYMGDFVANPNQTQYSAMPLYQQAAQGAQGAAALAGQGAQQAANFQTPLGFDQWQGQKYDTMPAIQAATAPLMRQLGQQILPSLQSDALMSGAYGNNRNMSLMPQMAIRDSMRGMQEIAAGIDYGEHARLQNERLQGYGAATQRGLGAAQLQQNGQLQALNLLPGLLDTQMRMQTGAADILSQSGSMQQQWDQSAIDNQLARFNYNLNYPFQGLDTATNLLAALSGNYGTQTTVGTNTQKQTQSSGGLAPILGGMIGLGSMVAGFPGVGGLFKGMGGGAGGAGPLSGFTPFSDRRLKRNIQKVGELADGLGVYIWNYIWGPLALGVMADEVERLRPWALGPRVQGFATVDYGRL